MSWTGTAPVLVVLRFDRLLIFFVVLDVGQETSPALPHESPAGEDSRLGILAQLGYSEPRGTSKVL